MEPIGISVNPDKLKADNAANMTEKDTSAQVHETSSAYEQRLKEFGLTKAEAAEIVGAIFDNGCYERKYVLLKKYPVVFSTRTTADTDRIVEQLEKAGYRTGPAASQLLSKYHLAASLQEFKRVSLRNKSLEERVKIIEALPDNIFRLLSQKLVEFDKMIETVLSDGAIENF